MTLTETHPRTLTWIQPSRFRPEFHVLSNDVPIATLRWEKLKAGPLGDAQAESEHGKWTIIPNTKQLLHRQIRVSWAPITVREMGSESEIARLSVKGTGNGLLEFPDGRRLQWKRTRGNWHPLGNSEWEFTNADGGRILRVNRKIGLKPFRKPTGRIEVEEGFKSMPELSLLTLLALFLVIRWGRQ